MTGLCPGGLAEEDAEVLAHGLAKGDLEGRIGLSQRLGQVAQIVGLAELMASVRQYSGHSGDQARLLVTQYRKNRPLQVLQRC